MASLCFVCLGNICRSPTAAGVMRHLVREAHLEGSITVQSAGTAGYHVGEPPDRRASAAAKRRGISIDNRGRQFKREDFARFDYVLCMDESNMEDLRRLADGAALENVRLLRSYDPASPRGAAVPDPYYGGDDGFDDVLDLCLAACRELLAVVRREHGL
jgi:protein-tyrosine phosphatase